MNMTENNQISTQLASPGHRLGAVAVDAGLYIVTFGIGWIIWNLVTMAKGQSPGKQILKVRVLGEKTNLPASWGHMLIRQFLIPLAMSLSFLIPYYVMVFNEFSNLSSTALIIEALIFIIYIAISIVDFVWLFGKSGRRLIDYWAGTYVVNEADK
jgi:uncharacterized RDD family membrane protein YckC